MLENLQVGDKLVIKGARPAKVVGVVGEVVFLYEGNDKSFAINGFLRQGLEDNGWQLEKKKWVAKYSESYWFIDSDGIVKWDNCYNSSYDTGRKQIGNMFETKESAEAYRNKLVEVMGREGV